MRVTTQSVLSNIIMSIVQNKYNQRLHLIVIQHYWTLPATDFMCSNNSLQHSSSKWKINIAKIQSKYLANQRTECIFTFGRQSFLLPIFIHQSKHFVLLRLKFVSHSWEKERDNQIFVLYQMKNADIRVLSNNLEWGRERKTNNKIWWFLNFLDQINCKLG